MMNLSARSLDGTNTKLRALRALWAATVTSVLLVLPSCAIPELNGPAPGAPLPDDFRGFSGTDDKGDANADNSSQLNWREFFNDPALADLVDQALVGNQELRILGQEIQIARNEILARSGEYLPFITGEAGAGLDKPSLFTPLGTAEDQLQPRPGVSFPDPLPDFMVATNLTWQVDIWRKLRNARDAAALRYLGTQDGQNYVVTRLVAEIAENYYQLLALDNRLSTLNYTISIQQQSQRLAQSKLENGEGTLLGVRRFEAEVRKNQSEKLIVQQDIVEAENRINFILGRYPQRVERKSAEFTQFIDMNLHALNVGVPAQLLRNRSDIRQAERELAAAGLDVRVARARFFPSLDINAGVGFRAFNTKYLFTSPESLIYNVAGDLVAPLINKRAIRADYLSANAMQLQALYNYQRVILNAYTEVINRMAKVVNYGESIEIKKQQLLALSGAVDSATKLYMAAEPGIDYVDVMLAQRDRMEARMVLIETKQEQLASIINTYQALGGGGWLPGGRPLWDGQGNPPVIAKMNQGEPPLQFKRDKGSYPTSPPSPMMPYPELLPSAPAMPSTPPDQQRLPSLPSPAPPAPATPPASPSPQSRSSGPDLLPIPPVVGGPQQRRETNPHVRPPAQPLTDARQVQYRQVSL